MKRGTWNEITDYTDTDYNATDVAALLRDAAAADKIDEHGSWDFGCEFDRKGRGEALNCDIYGISRDCHDNGLLLVVQIRQYRKQHKNWYPSIRKNYFLVGRNEDGAAFAHPVSANVVHAAIRADRDVCLACQNWIFGGDYAAMRRQGDIALVRLPRRPAAERIADREITLLDSHRLQAVELRQNGHLYACNPNMTHLPGTHAQIAVEGWYRVVIGVRADFWRFAAPTAD